MSIGIEIEIECRYRETILQLQDPHTLIMI